MNNRTTNDYISVDCVIFGYNGQDLQVLLVDRTLKDKELKQTLFTDQTLTGNHIYEDETIEAAAHRILFDLTGLTNVFLEHFGAFAHPNRLKKDNDRLWLQHHGRNPDKRIVSIGYFALMATQNVTLEWKGRNVSWVNVSDVGKLAFDHNLILEKALIALRQKIKHEPIGFELLPDKFTLTQLQMVYETILGTGLDKRNFRKKTARMKYLIALDEKQKGVAHKPARLYVFSREVYEKTRKELFDFTI
jgi:hypothetical protein